jgi:DNA repair protein RadC
MTKNLPSTLLMSSSEIELHYKRPLFQTMKYISKSEDAETVLRAYINPNRIDLKEFFWVLLLSNANRLIAVAEIASGSPRAVHVQIREILQLALKTNASNLILAHCHPSGNLNISKSDEKLTSKLEELCELLELNLLDHIIITSESYTSFSDSQRLT